MPAQPGSAVHQVGAKRSRSDRRPGWAASNPAVLLVLTGVALALRIPGVLQGLIGDEVHTYGVVYGRDLGGVLEEIRSGGEVSPPLYFLLAWAGAKTWDPTLWVRIPSLVFGTAAVPLTYLLGLRTVGRPAALLGAAMLAISPSAIFFASETRPYAMLMCLVALSTLLLLHAEASRTRGAWALYVVSIVAVLYTHYFGILPVVAQMLWLVWLRRVPWRTAGIVFGAALLALVPWIPSVASQRPNHSDIGAYVPQSLEWIMKQLTMVLPGHPIYPGADIPGTAVQAAFVAVLGLVLLAGLARLIAARERWRLGSGPAALLVLVAAVTGLGLLAISFLGDNTFQVRYLFGGLPAFLLLVAAMGSALPRRVAWVAAVALLALLAVGTFRTLETRYARAPFDEAAHYIEDRATPRDAVLDASGFAIGPRLRQYLRPIEIYLTDSGLRLYGARDVDRLLSEPPEGGRLFVAGIETGVLRVPTPEPDSGLCQLGHEVFPGHSDVGVYTYAAAGDRDSPTPARLERRDGGELVVLPSGLEVPLSPGAAVGYLERVRERGRTITAGGWAVDEAGHLEPGCILVFYRDRLLMSGAVTFARDDVAATRGAWASKSGFELSATMPGAAPPPGVSDLRAFALVDGKAAELPHLEP